MSVGDLIVRTSSFFRSAMPAKAERATRWIDVFFGSSTTARIVERAETADAAA